MDAPPDKEDCRPFVAIAQQLRAGGLHAPQIIAENHEQGFLLLEDLGDRLLADALNEDTVDSLYQQAMTALLAIQQLDNTALARYDADLLQTELSLFPEWLCNRHLQQQVNAAQQPQWQECIDLLVDNATAQPQVFVHRDFHSRNLMLPANSTLGIIDFQDAVAGPITYDLVSLLRDCYQRWPDQQVQGWSEGYRQQAVSQGLCDADPQQWRRWFDFMGVQRHLKAAGIFCRLYYRDGKAGYLADIPRTLGYIVDVAADHQELNWLGQYVSQEVLPALSEAGTA